MMEWCAMGRRTSAQRENRNERERQRYADDPEYRKKRLASANAYKALHRDERNMQLRERYATDSEFRAAAQASNRKSRLKVSLDDYGMSLEDYERMLACQNRKCLICQEEFQRTPCLDHDHDTDELRALLCRRCNLGLGHFADNPLWLRRAADHVKRRLRPPGDDHRQPLPGGDDDARQLIRRTMLRELHRPHGCDRPAPVDKLQQIVRALIDKAGERDMIVIRDSLGPDKRC